MLFLFELLYNLLRRNSENCNFAKQNSDFNGKCTDPALILYSVDRFSITIYVLHIHRCRYSEVLPKNRISRRNMAMSCQNFLMKTFLENVHPPYDFLISTLFNTFPSIETLVFWKRLLYHCRVPMIIEKSQGWIFSSLLFKAFSTWVKLDERIIYNTCIVNVPSCWWIIQTIWEIVNIQQKQKRTKIWSLERPILLMIVTVKSNE